MMTTQRNSYAQHFAEIYGRDLTFIQNHNRATISIIDDGHQIAEITALELATVENQEELDEVVLKQIEEGERKLKWWYRAKERVKDFIKFVIQKWV